MIVQILLLVLLALLAVLFISYKKPRAKIIPPLDKELLTELVAFYGRLNEEGKARFEEKIKDFMGNVLIEGIHTNVDDRDKLLVASSAVIPVFGFPQWKYGNLKNVLLYPENFNREEFLAPGYEKNTLGMIGNGPMQRVMILSKPALHEGFKNATGRENTGIHEFVHLLDKEDGDVDGLPEVLLNKKNNASWLALVNAHMEAILEGKTDIPVYGATDKAEFFAVAAEYFFNSPHSFRGNHPDLYKAMTEIFNQNPAGSQHG